MFRAVDSVVGGPTSYSSPGNDEVMKFITFSTNMNRSPHEGSQKTEKRHGQIRWILLFFFFCSLITASCGGSQLALAFSFLFLFLLFPADDYIEMSQLFVTSKPVTIQQISKANSTELLRLAAMDSDER